MYAHTNLLCGVCHPRLTGPTGATGPRGPPGPGCIYSAEAEYYPVMQGDGPYPNPNGLWTVGYGGAVLEQTGLALVPYNTSGPWQANQNLHCFFLPDQGDGELPYFCQNLDTLPQEDIAPRQVALHPYEGSARYSALRWYAPKPGIYEVNATFFEGQAGAIEARVFIFTGYPTANVSVALSNVTTTTQIIRTAELTTGAYIDVIVGKDADGFAGDATPIDVTIRDVRCIGDTGCVLAAEPLLCVVYCDGRCDHRWYISKAF